MSGIVIGLGGKLRAGKDAVADHLVDAHGFAKIGMSDPLLEHALILDPWLPYNAAPAPHGLPGTLSGDFIKASELVRQVGYVEAKKNDEFRRFLQADGTPGGRDFHHENVWVDRAGKSILGHLEAGRNVVLTGVRFPNEVTLVQQFAGYSVWVERPSLADSTAPASTHASENSVSAADFAHTITNDGTLEDLYRAVDQLLKGATA